MDRNDVLQLYDREAVRLRHWLQGETGNRETATDLTAETFAQALVARRRFRGGDETAWLYGIARNLLSRYRRRARVETSARKRLGMPVRDYAEYDEAEELADAQRLAPALEEALAGLPEHERAALDLRVVSRSSRSTKSRSGSPWPRPRPGCASPEPSERFAPGSQEPPDAAAGRLVRARP